jgi:hypothetical protein
VYAHKAQLCSICVSIVVGLAQWTATASAARAVRTGASTVRTGRHDFITVVQLWYKCNTAVCGRCKTVIAGTYVLSMHDEPGLGAYAYHKVIATRLSMHSSTETHR